MADSTGQGTGDKAVAGPTKLAGSTPTPAVGEERACASTAAHERVAGQPRDAEKEGVEKKASESKSCPTLPDERRLWKFLEGVKGWRFTGSGWTVCGPEGGGDSGSPMEAAELPQYVFSRPSLLAEYEEWHKRQKDGHGQEKPHEPARPKEKTQHKGAVVEKGEQTPTSEVREHAQEARAPPTTPADKPSSVVDLSRTVKGRAETGVSPEAPAAGKKPATVVDLALAGTVEVSTETPSQGGLSPKATAAAEKPSRACAVELSPAAAAAAAAAAGVQGGASTAAAGKPCSPPPKPSESVRLGDIEGPTEGGMAGLDNGKEAPHQGVAMDVEGEAGVEEVEVMMKAKGKVQETPEVTMEAGGEAGRKAAQGEKAVGDDAGHHRGGASAGAGAAASGDVAGAAGGGGAGAATKSKEKGKEKGDGKCPTDAKQPQQGTPFGPCMCPKGSDGAHKTVDVERRCWPGSNKPGGIARITKKYTVEEELFGDMVQSSYFDIKYLLGGSEKRVKECFLTCTPLEMAARQSAPCDRFTVEHQPTTRRQKPARTSPAPAPTPTRMSPLAPRVGSNTSVSSSLKAKAKGSASLNKTSAPVKRSKPTAVAVAGGQEGKGPRKRAKITEGGGRDRKRASSQAECKENQGVHREREVPARNEEPARHAITDLSVVVEATKAPSAPLSAGRMDAFQVALGALFRQSTTDTIPLAKVHAGVNGQVVQGTSPFDPNEVTLSLKYLEDVESKVMLDNGMLYRI